MSLREACLAKDHAKVKKLLAQAGSDVQLVVNIALSGSNTLLFL